MPRPFILMTTSTIKDGELDNVKVPMFQQVLRMNAEQGAIVRVTPSHLAGFTTAARV
ncbi:MAG: hypothetical protein JO243_24670 [Solirubrobacterales bacterium]|nr:hypothetical protein [Solirubrobacterales bacterium]